MLSSEIGR